MYSVSCMLPVCLLGCGDFLSPSSSPPFSMHLLLSLMAHAQPLWTDVLPSRHGSTSGCLTQGSELLYLWIKILEGFLFPRYLHFMSKL